MARTLLSLASILMGCVTASAGLLVGGTAHATPEALRAVVVADRAVPLLEVEPVARKAALAEDRARPGGPGRMAIARTVSGSLDTHGVWTTLADGRRAWQLRVRAAGAEHLSLAFERAELPAGAEVWMHATDGRHALSRPMTDQDAARGELWTPLVEGDEVVVTLLVPGAVMAPVLDLTRVHVGYRNIGAPPPQGWCNIDTTCPEGDDWREEIASVAVYAFSGTFYCTGVMLSNTAQDQRPYFATANHCGVRSSNAGSIVLYWNYESPVCGDLSGGPLNDWQSGATVRAQVSDPDWTLIELDDAPDADWEVSWAGWDRSGEETSGAVVIHHPGTDEKAISFEDDPTTVTDPYESSRDSNGSHIRVADWDLGTTEGGSSGSPLFDPEHRVVGVLTGGDAACGNDDADWFGRLYKAWDGSNTSRRLVDWLDPDGTGAETVDTLSPWAAGVSITPRTGLTAGGPVGGPFSPSTLQVSLENRDLEARSVEFGADGAWVSLSAASVTLAPEASDSVTVGFSDEAAALPAGAYSATVTVQADDGNAALELPVNLLVGDPVTRYAWDLSTDPGWDTEGDWEWGVPEGRGGSDGHRDPTSGYTGDHVYGYNLAGDYPDNMRAKDLTTPPLDMRAMVGTTLVFQRWLGVEESSYDHAEVAVSTNGSNWTTVWENAGDVDDGAWVPIRIDISEYVDDEPAVQIRWTMGSSDEDVRFCGWNIDDIEIEGIPVGEWAPDTGTDPGDDTGTEPVDDTGNVVLPIDTGDSDPRDKDEDDEISACGCAAGGGAALGWLGLVPLIAIVRRRED
jgi:hypothetical protein